MAAGLPRVCLYCIGLVCPDCDPAQQPATYAGWPGTDRAVYADVLAGHGLADAGWSCLRACTVGRAQTHEANRHWIGAMRLERQHIPGRVVSLAPELHG